ncbi:MAG: AAA family ATPase, partial [Flavobacteriales bacterium]|nr:AAA family ATPase [Flavobacteriales bacterium]
MPIIVLTGVENAGKTTLTKMLSEELTWPWIPEFARTDERVVNQATEHQDLQRLHDAFRRSLDENRDNGTDHLICDTGALVLDMWSRTVFHRPL